MNDCYCENSCRVKVAGIILDAASKTERFLGMKELFDIARRKITDNAYIPTETEFTYANKGIVAILPENEEDTIRVMFSKCADEQARCASTTKVLSIITGLPYISSIKEKVTVIADDIQVGSGNYFKVGDILSIEEIIYGMLLPSSNTCAMLFARIIGMKILGDETKSTKEYVDAFIVEMNKKAEELGCENSLFDTPSGLSITNVSTASDLLKILLEANTINEIRAIWNKKEYEITIGGINARRIVIRTTLTNEELEESYFILGGKTGFLPNPSGANALVMIAEIAGNI